MSRRFGRQQRRKLEQKLDKAVAELCLLQVQFRDVMGAFYNRGGVSGVDAVYVPVKNSRAAKAYRDELAAQINEARKQTC